MPVDVPLGPALRQLRARGFSRVHISPKVHSFEGSLPCAKGKVPVRLDVRDWDFLTYPTIQLLDLPAFLPKVLPHVSADGVLCLFAESSVVLDRYRPELAVAQCLDKATWLLDQIVDNPDFYEAEFHGEFLVHWANADGPRAFGGLVGEHSKRVTAMQWYDVGSAEGAPASERTGQSPAPGDCSPHSMPCCASHVSRRGATSSMRTTSTCRHCSRTRSSCTSRRWPSAA